MQSDKNFRSVAYAARSENLRPFQRRTCSYFCLPAADCFHVWVATSLGECLSLPRVCISLFRVPLSLSRPSRLSLSWQSYVVGVVIWISNPQVTSSVNARQQQINNYITKRKINSTVLMCVCVCVCVCVQATVVPDPTSPFISTHHKRLQQA
jgi:hypothetical protein